MKRKALIIGAHNGDLLGVDLDLANYKHFLLSPLGGAWYDTEIQVLKNPSKINAVNALDELRRADYSMIIFAGHGRQPNAYSPVIVQINSNETLEDSDLKRGANKHTLILDCCREFDRIIQEKTLNFSAEARYDSNSESQSRLYYEKEIAKAAQGLVVMYGCAANETSGDSSELGGYYSSSILKSAKEWKDQDQTDLGRYYNVLNVCEAHERSLAKVDKLSGGRQNPKIDKPRSGPYFPFAINSR